MSSRLQVLFDDEALKRSIQTKLPKLFVIAQLESQRGGHTGMEVGSLREKILVALLIFTFGGENVDTEIPITEPAVDVKLFGEPVAIKSVTGWGGVKVVWTVDRPSALRFQQNYVPICDVLLAQIFWNSKKGGLFLVPLETQQRVFAKMGMQQFLQLPKPGTNPRGVEWSRPAFRALLEETATRRIEMLWERSSVQYDPYKRWVDYWKEGLR